MKLKLTARIATINKMHSLKFFVADVNAIKEKLLKRLIAHDDDFKQIKEPKEKEDKAKEKLKILDAEALAISKEIGKDSYKGWVLSLIGEENSGVGFKVHNKQLEDRGGLIDALKEYHYLKIKGDLNVDIFTFKSLSTLLDKINQVKSSEDFADSVKIAKEKWINFFKNGDDLKGATKLFSNGTYSAYHVTGNNEETQNALIKMSGKDPAQVRNPKIGNDATRYFSKCTWCTAGTSYAKSYLKDYKCLIMFYENGLPIIEIVGSKETYKEIHDEANRKIAIKDFIEKFRKMGTKENEREYVWDALYIDPLIGNDLLDNPEAHNTSLKAAGLNNSL